MKKIIKKIVAIINKSYYKYYERVLEKNKIKEKERVRIQNRVELTKEQKKQIDKFYLENYGKKIPYNWHKNYYAISGSFDYKYFPELLFIPEFERLLNNPKYFHALQDKNILPLLVQGFDFVTTPKKIISCSNGIITDSHANILSFDSALNTLNNKVFFIKPSVDSSSGQNCIICKIKNMIDEKTNKSLRDILLSYKMNWVAQEIVINSKELRQINESSLNTFRCMTYILDGQIYHMPLILRIGRNGAIVDNAHAGGMFIGVTDDGHLLKTAHTEFGESFDIHPDSNLIFENHYIPQVPEIITVAKKLQSQIPHVGCVSWDFTINQDSEIVLIEANTRYGSIWLIEMAHGKGAFGENTEKALRFIRGK